MDIMQIGIIGNGFVGKTLLSLKCDDIDVLAYDANPQACYPVPGLKLNDLMRCDIIFISVPTPMNPDGSCHIDIIISVLEELKLLQYGGFVVLRSTIPVGTCDKLNVFFMPEFLTEKNFLEDFRSNKNWFFGLLNSDKDEPFKKQIRNLFYLAFENDKIAYNNIHFMPNGEAEMIKLFRNCFLSVKVSFCNEIYDYCIAKNLNYDNIRSLACADDRIGLSHTSVPGHDGMRGFGGTCFPKDTASLLHEMKINGVQSRILDAAIERNNTQDRPAQDWKLDKGRAVV
jgi:UDPglucose 6-dehydrogenase